MTRHIVRTDQVAHLWAHQAQDWAANSCRSIRFEGPTCYSFGHHFPMASFVENDKGERAVLWTVREYSKTTQRHKQLVLRAIPERVPVFRVRWVDPQFRHADNLRDFDARLSEAWAKTKLARSNRVWLLEQARELLNHRNEYAGFFGVDAPVLDLPQDYLARMTRAREILAQHEARREEQARRAQARAAELARHHVEAFRAGRPFSAYALYGCPVMLRVEGNELVTSKGARVPLDHAIRVFRFICDCKAHGRTYTHNGHTIHAGAFRIDSIDEQGNLRAGCHLIEWAEIERTAAALGLIEVPHAAA